MATSNSTHSYLSYTDGIANSTANIVLLIARVLLGWIFLASGSSKLMNMAGFVGYLTSLKVPAPTFFAWIGAPVEFALGLALILGIATRYASLLGVVFVLVATALAHRYWEYPAPQVMAQYNNFLKNLAIMGGLAAVFVTGAGRFSLDAILGRGR